MYEITQGHLVIPKKQNSDQNSRAVTGHRSHAKESSLAKDEGICPSQGLIMAMH